MNWEKVSRDFIYGIDVYTLTTNNKIPYQITFERDLFLDRINVNLLPLIHPEKNVCYDLRKLVCDSFLDYFENNENETVYFEIDISNKYGELKMIKFLKWIEPYRDNYIIDFNFTNYNSIRYMEVTIKRK
ncbi:TPA: hypothetical protein ACGQK4_002248 [Elizabethkingia anophelis]|nr:hypothetical protein CQS02_00110 [Elizabethkingia miricola]MCT4263348.1 hypothetical protein [Elizabethkingia anophelis]